MLSSFKDRCLLMRSFSSMLLLLWPNLPVKGRVAKYTSSEPNSSVSCFWIARPWWANSKPPAIKSSKLPVKTWSMTVSRKTVRSSAYLEAAQGIFVPAFEPLAQDEFVRNMIDCDTFLWHSDEITLQVELLRVSFFLQISNPIWYKWYNRYKTIFACNIRYYSVHLLVQNFWMIFLWLFW